MKLPSRGQNHEGQPTKKAPTKKRGHTLLKKDPVDFTVNTDNWAQLFKASLA